MDIKRYGIILVFLLSLLILIHVAHAETVQIPACSVYPIPITLENPEISNDTFFLHLNGTTPQWATIQHAIVPVEKGGVKTVYLYVHAPCEVGRDGNVAVYIDSYLTKTRKELLFTFHLVEEDNLQIEAESVRKDVCTGQTAVYKLNISNTATYAQDLSLTTDTSLVSVTPMVRVPAGGSSMVLVYASTMSTETKNIIVAIKSKTTNTTRRIVLQLLGQDCGILPAVPAALSNPFCSIPGIHQVAITNEAATSQMYEIVAFYGTIQVSRITATVPGGDTAHINVSVNAPYNETRVYDIHISSVSGNTKMLLVNYSTASIASQFCYTPVVVNQVVGLNSSGKGVVSIVNRGYLTATYSVHIQSDQFVTAPMTLRLQPGQKGYETIEYVGEGTLNNTRIPLTMTLQVDNLNYTAGMTIIPPTHQTRTIIITLLFVLALLLVLIIILLTLQSQKGKQKKREDILETFKEKPLIKRVSVQDLFRKRYYQFPLFWILLAIVAIIAFVIFWLADFSLITLKDILWTDLVIVGGSLRRFWLWLLRYIMFVILGIILGIILIILRIIHHKKPLQQRILKLWHRYREQRKIRMKAKEEAQNEYEEYFSKKITEERAKMIEEPPAEKVTEGLILKRKPAAKEQAVPYLKTKNVRKCFRSILWSSWLWAIILILIIFVGGLFIFYASLQLIKSVILSVWIWIQSYLPYLVLGLILIIFLLLVLRVVDDYKKYREKRDKRKKVADKEKNLLLGYVIGIIVIAILLIVFFWGKGLISMVHPNHSEEGVPLPFNVTNFTETPKRLVWNENTVKVINLFNYFADPDEDELSFTVNLNKNITVTLDREGNAYLVPDYNWYGMEEVYFSAFDSRGGGVDSPRITLIVRPVNFTENKYYILFNNLSIKTLDLTQYIVDPDKQQLTYSVAESANISIRVEDNQAYLTPPENLSGVRVVRFSATDPEGVSTTTPPIHVIINTTGQFYNPPFSLLDYSGYIIFAFLVLVFIIAWIKLQE